MTEHQSVDECWFTLWRAQVGRVAVAAMEILPVNFVANLSGRRFAGYW